MRAERDTQESRLLLQMQKWADRKATLKDVRGYKDEELYAIAKTAYFFYYQGRLEEARTLFQGLYAVNPTDPYFAKALGVVELASGNTQGALAAYNVAQSLSPEDPAVYLSRAEVKLALGQKAQAADDLRVAAAKADEDDPLRFKAEAMLEALVRK